MMRLLRPRSGICSGGGCGLRSALVSVSSAAAPKSATRYFLVAAALTGIRGGVLVSPCHAQPALLASTSSPGAAFSLPCSASQYLHTKRCTSSSLAKRETPRFLAPTTSRVNFLHPSSSTTSFPIRQQRRFSTTTTVLHSIDSIPGKQTENERQMTKDALQIISAAIESVNPRAAVRNCLLSPASSSDALPGSLVLRDPASSNEFTLYNQNDYDEVIIVSFGKASSAMALAAAEIVAKSMPNVKLGGIAVVKDDHATAEESNLLPNQYSISIREASHPIPDDRSASAASEILDLVGVANERTLVISCISGGGSALFCSPRPPLTLDDLAQTNTCLLASGMSIDNMNVIRKRLELGKGGRLAAAAYPATTMALVLSDIVGDPLDLIASGPTVPDTSSWEDAMELVNLFGLGRGGEYELPSTVLDAMDKGVRGELEDTPNENHPAFSTQRHVSNGKEAPSMLTETVLVGNNELAVRSAAKEADKLGYNTVVLGCTIEGEAKDIAGVYTSLAEQLSKQHSSSSSSANFSLAKLPAALIAGGETTVTLGPTSGKGGRNQEIGLVAALDFKAKGIRDVVLASAGTDGTDGPTDAAGAIIDGGTIDRIEFMNGESMKGEEALRNHDAYTFFDFFFDSSTCKEENERETTDPLIRTGPTGTNVADVCVVLVR